MADEFDQWVQNYSQMKKNASVADKLDIISMQLLEIEENTKKVPEIAQEVEGQNNEIDQANQAAGAVPGMPMGAPPAGAPPAGAPPGAEGGAPAPMDNDGLVPAGPVEASASPKKVIRSKHSIAKESTEKSGFQETPEAKSSAAFDDLLRVLGDAVKESAQGGNSALAIQLSNIQEAVEQLIKDSDLPESEKKKLKKAKTVATTPELERALRHDEMAQSGNDRSYVESRVLDLQRRWIESIKNMRKAISSVDAETIPGKIPLVKKVFRYSTYLLPKESRSALFPKGKLPETLSTNELNKFCADLISHCTLDKVTELCTNDEGRVDNNTTNALWDQLGFDQVTMSPPKFTAQGKGNYYTHAGGATADKRLIRDSLSALVPEGLFSANSYYINIPKGSTRPVADIRREQNNSRVEAILKFFQDEIGQTQCREFCRDVCNWAFGSQLYFLLDKEKNMSSVYARHVLALQVKNTLHQMDATRERIQKIFDTGTLDQKLDLLLTCSGERDKVLESQEYNYGGRATSNEEIKFLAGRKNRAGGTPLIFAKDTTRDLFSDIKAIDISGGDVENLKGEVPLEHCMLIAPETRQKLRQYESSGTPESQAELNNLITEAINEDSNYKAKRAKYGKVKVRSRVAVQSGSGSSPAAPTAGEMQEDYAAHGGDPVSGDAEEDKATDLLGGLPEEPADPGAKGEDEGDVNLGPGTNPDEAQDNERGDVDEVISAGDKAAINLDNGPRRKLSDEESLPAEAQTRLRLIGESPQIQYLTNTFRRTYPSMSLEKVSVYGDGQGIILTYNMGPEYSNQTWEKVIPLDALPKDLLDKLTIYSADGLVFEPAKVLYMSTLYDQRAAEAKEAFTNGQLNAFNSPTPNTNRQYNPDAHIPYAPELGVNADTYDRLYPGADLSNPSPRSAVPLLEDRINQMMTESEEKLQVIYRNLSTMRVELLMRGGGNNEVLNETVIPCLEKCLRGLKNTVPLGYFKHLLSKLDQAIKGLEANQNTNISAKMAYELYTSAMNSIEGKSEDKPYCGAYLDSKGNYLGSGTVDIVDFAKLYAEGAGPLERYRQMDPQEAAQEVYKSIFGDGAPPAVYGSAQRVLNQFAERIPRFFAEYRAPPVLSAVNLESSRKDMFKALKVARRDIADSLGIEDPRILQQALDGKTPEEIFTLAQKARQVRMWFAEDDEDPEDLREKGERLISAKLMGRLGKQLLRLLGPEEGKLISPDQYITMGNLAWNKYIVGNKLDKDVTNGFISGAGLAPATTITDWMADNGFSTDNSLNAAANQYKTKYKAAKDALVGIDGTIQTYARNHPIVKNNDKKGDWVTTLCTDACEAFGLKPNQRYQVIAKFKTYQEEIAKHKYPVQTDEALLQLAMKTAVVSKYTADYNEAMSGLLNKAWSENTLLEGASGTGKDGPINTYLSIYKSLPTPSLAALKSYVKNMTLPSADGTSKVLNKDLIVTLNKMLSSYDPLVTSLANVKDYLANPDRVTAELPSTTPFRKLGDYVIYMLANEVNDNVEQHKADKNAPINFSEEEVAVANKLVSDLKFEDEQTSATDLADVKVFPIDDFTSGTLANKDGFYLHPYYSSKTVRHPLFGNPERMDDYNITPEKDIWDTEMDQYREYMGAKKDERQQLRSTYDLTDRDLTNITALKAYDQARKKLEKAEKANSTPEVLKPLQDEVVNRFNELPESLKVYLSVQRLKNHFGSRVMPTSLASSLYADGINLQAYAQDQDSSTMDEITAAIDKLSNLASSAEDMDQETYKALGGARDEVRRLVDKQKLESSLTNAVSESGNDALVHYGSGLTYDLLTGGDSPQVTMWPTNVSIVKPYDSNALMARRAQAAQPGGVPLGVEAPMSLREATKAEIPESQSWDPEIGYWKNFSSARYDADSDQFVEDIDTDYEKTRDKSLPKISTDGKAQSQGVGISFQNEYDDIV